MLKLGQAKGRSPGRKWLTVPFRRPNDSHVLATERVSGIGAPQKKRSQKFFFHAGGFERRHFNHDFNRRFDQTYEQAGAGPLAQAHLEIQRRGELELVEQQAVTFFGGKMRGEENVVDTRAE